MDPSKLVSLTIFNAASVDPWAPFSTAGSRDIVFPSLEHLAISDTGEGPANDDETQPPNEDEWRLCLPRLKNLEFMCIRDGCTLLERALFPSHMDAIQISVSMPVLLATAEIQLPTTRSIGITIDIKSEEHDAVLAATNRIFGNARGAEELRFVQLDFSNLDADLSAPEPGADCQVEPLNTRIRGPVMEFVDTYARCHAGRCQTTLLLLTPRMDRLQASDFTLLQQCAELLGLCADGGEHRAELVQRMDAIGQHMARLRTSVAALPGIGISQSDQKKVLAECQQDLDNTLAGLAAYCQSLPP
ncbi:hypothetical protein H4R18_003306 [Coemansia javaensis]|uniref:Uncharacterized protein n=1 Tax=Coemansia javaensis TaxID=2761396 RepID=A0A9W8LIM3_9FUNG|nr:hypothetical protein H4R18_003306 [Coemansia javaensis]